MTLSELFGKDTLPASIDQSFLEISEILWKSPMIREHRGLPMKTRIIVKKEKSNG